MFFDTRSPSISARHSPAGLTIGWRPKWRSAFFGAGHVTWRRRSWRGVIPLAAHTAITECAAASANHAGLQETKHPQHANNGFALHPSRSREGGHPSCFGSNRSPVRLRPPRPFRRLTRESIGRVVRAYCVRTPRAGLRSLSRSTSQTVHDAGPSRRRKEFNSPVEYHLRLRS